MIDRDRLIVASLIGLAHDLGLDVVAEGVESSQVWNQLASMHCDIAQGFGIAVPMDYPELRTWMARWDTAIDPRQLMAANSPSVEPGLSLRSGG